MKILQGKLRDGREIAVKRLSSSSGQGIEELKTETLVISKLQHRNLAKVLGFCIQEEEKLLIYELMPNRSLDIFIFGWLQHICFTLLSLILASVFFFPCS